MTWVNITIGIGLGLSGWLIARAVAGAWRNSPLVAVLLDATAPISIFVIFFAMTGRPIAAGVFDLALFGGFAFVDRVKRFALREPVVFTDMSEVRELFRHPSLYLPFAGPC